MSNSRSHEPIEAVVFDLGNVLIKLDFQLANREVAKIVGLPADEVERRIVRCPAFLDFERGTVTERGFHKHMETALEHPVPYDTFHELWNSIFTDEIESTVTIAHRLRKRLKVGLLSNTNVLHFEFLRRKMTILQQMEYLFVSHEMGCRKPEAAAYTHVLKNMSVKPQRSVFVDDLEANVAGARAVGMHAIHATDAKAVESGLAALGLLES